MLRKRAPNLVKGIALDVIIVKTHKKMFYGCFGPVARLVRGGLVEKLVEKLIGGDPSESDQVKAVQVKTVR